MSLCQNQRFRYEYQIIWLLREYCHYNVLENTKYMHKRLKKCTNPISINAPLWNISVTKRCIVWYLSDALRNLWDGRFALMRRGLNKKVACFRRHFQIQILNIIVFWLKFPLTQWGRVMHICVRKLTIIGSDNDLSPGWRQAIIGTGTGKLSIGPLGTNFSEILIEVYTLSYHEITFGNFTWKMAAIFTASMS